MNRLRLPRTSHSARSTQHAALLLLLLLCVACSGGGGGKPVRPSVTAGTFATPIPGAISEGVHLTGADAWHAAGITGKGVSIGVIDLGFTNAQQILGNAAVVAKSFRPDGLIGDTTADADTMHGTACAEIVHEMAPDATLYLAAAGESPGGFIAALQWLVQEARVPIVTTSLGFYGDEPTDGSSAIAQAVDRARAAGVFVVKSAGNIAQQHYGATFTDTDGDGLHDFPGAKISNSLGVQHRGGLLEISLTWDDWKQPHVNYDLFLYDSGGKEVARSDTDQMKPGKQPVERVAATLPAGAYALKVRKVNPRDPNLPFNLYIRGAQPERTTPEGSLTVPADARGALAVGAIGVANDMVEPFSSRGPTQDGRAKPEIGAPDGVTSAAYGTVGVTSFTGTSAAAPHVAGAAALYKQAVPDATADALTQFVTERASAPKGSLAGTNVSGAGRLALGQPPAGGSGQAAGGRQPTPIMSGTPIAAGSTFSDPLTAPGSGLDAAGYTPAGYQLTAAASTLQTAAYPRAATADATYEVRVRRSGGAADAVMGLAIHRTDPQNELLFVIAGDGAFTVLAKEGGSTRSLTNGWQPSGAIRADGDNTLRIEVSGGAFAFSVNGQSLTRLTIAGSDARGGFGLVAGGGKTAGADILFTNLTVTAR